ncbi:hypothetical protein CDD83_5056 [Cordyceps sp. RAO-2017]|nr:hypothetical protein CDD83_5056 [Cordyceps sp. RAO-2017]
MQPASASSPSSPSPISGHDPGSGQLRPGPSPRRASTRRTAMRPGPSAWHRPFHFAIDLASDSPEVRRRACVHTRPEEPGPVPDWCACSKNSVVVVGLYMHTEIYVLALCARWLESIRSFVVRPVGRGRYDGVARIGPVSLPKDMPSTHHRFRAREVASLLFFASGPLYPIFSAPRAAPPPIGPPDVGWPAPAILPPSGRPRSWAQGSEARWRVRGWPWAIDQVPAGLTRRGRRPNRWPPAAIDSQPTLALPACLPCLPGPWSMGKALSSTANPGWVWIRGLRPT